MTTRPNTPRGIPTRAKPARRGDHFWRLWEFLMPRTERHRAGSVRWLAGLLALLPAAVAADLFVGWLDGADDEQLLAVARRLRPFLLLARDEERGDR